ncbi:MAG: type IV pilus secretin PilQ [Desulfobacterales bacterium]
MASYDRTEQFLARLISFLLVAALILGCTTPPPPAEKGIFDEWKARVAESQAYSPSPKKHTRESMPGDHRNAVAKADVLQPPPEKPLPTRKITMKMNDIDVPVLLRALARIANQNIMLNDKVTGKININITEAPWDQVFKSILRTQGLTYAWEGDIIRVMTVQDMETELKREEQRNQLDKAEPLTTEVVKISYASAIKLRENMQQFLSLDREGKPLGSVLVDEHTNSLIIQAIPSDLRRMLAVVDQLDRPIAQILIQAYIVETSNDTARALGVQWGGLAYGTSNGNNIWVGPDGVNFEDRTSIKDENGNPIENLWPLGNISNFPVPLPDNIGLSLGFLFQNVGRTALSLQLQALQQEGRLNILSSPSITTLENQIALIESGSRIPIQTVENGEVNIEYVQATLRLEVTSNVIDSDTLKLRILTNKDEPDFSRPVAGNPTIITKKAETNVILLNGQTTVIGGLNKETTTSNQAGIPYLKDVPGLGWLFGSRSRGGAMDDVLIFITPYILEEKPLSTAASSSGVPYNTVKP